MDPVQPPVIQTTEPQAPAQKTVALENFQAVVQAKTGLEAKVQGLQTELQRALEKAATADVLTAQVQDWRQKAEQAEQKYSSYTDFAGVLGTTSEKVIGIYDAEYRGLPPENRPSRKAWVEQLRADPAQAPEHLAPWLSPAQVQKATPPRIPGAPTQPPGAPSSVSAEEIARVRETAIKTGNWAEWKKMRENMGSRK